MAKNIIDRYSNYNFYAVGTQLVPAHTIDEDRLQNILESCAKLLSKPFIRFMSVANVEEAHCVVYNRDNRLTKIIPISEVEKMIEEGKFHK